jgi:WD40 repeat protein
VNAGLPPAGAGANVDELLAANPYPGLRAFQPGESDRFFGREDQVEALVHRLATTPIVTVSGTSGCGKSSLVLAGLLRALVETGDDDEATHWRHVVVRPGNHPIARLAERLEAALSANPSETPDPMRVAALDGRLRLGGLALLEAVRVAALPARARVLVVVDQFEEIFRLKRMTDPEEAAAFVKLLLNAADDPGTPVSVVLTVRSEALGLCAEFRGLPEAVNRGLMLVPRLTRDQRRAAIVRPAEVRGASVAPRLVQRLLNDVSDDYDDLPVMQHALARTWWRWARTSGGSRPLDLEDYEAIGGAARALSQHADEAADSLDAMLHPLVPKVFRALTESVPEGPPIRRPLVFSTLCAIADAPREQVAAVVDRFRRADTAFVMPPPDTALDGDPVIDISHESLIRQWGRLRRWVAEEATARATLTRLIAAAHAWKRDEGNPWRGRDLERALEWQAATRPNAAWVGLCTGADGEQDLGAVREFLDASVADARREKRRWRAVVWSLRGLALAIVVMSVVGVVGETALQKRASSRELASLALLDLQKDPARSAHIAAAALDQDPDNRRAEFALRQSLTTLSQAHATRIVDVGQPIVDLRYTIDGRELVVVTEHSTRRFDAATFAPIGRPIQFNHHVYRGWWLAGVRMHLVEFDTQAQLVDADGRVVQSLVCADAKDDALVLVVVRRDEQEVALGCRSGEILRLQTAGGAVRELPALRVPPARRAPITSMDYSGDGQWLASGDLQGVVRVWKLGAEKEPWLAGDAGDGEMAKALRHAPSMAVRAVSFNTTDPEFVASAGDDLQAIVWQVDLAHRKVVRPGKGATEPPWRLIHDHPVIIARFFQPSQRDLGQWLMTVSDKRLRVWNNATPSPARQHDDWVLDANASDDGELLVSAGGDGLAFVWSSRNAFPIASLRGHRDAVTNALFVPGSHDIVTGSQDGTLRLWKIAAPQAMVIQTRWMLGTESEPGGRRIVACGEAQQEWHAQCSLLDADAPPPDPDDLPKTALQAFDSDSVIRPSWSSDGQWILAVGQTGDIYAESHAVLWDARSRKNVTPSWLKSMVWARFDPAHPRLATIAVGGAMALWDTDALKHEDAPQPLRQWEAVPERQMVMLGADGRWLAAVEGSVVRAWRLDDPKAPPLVLSGHGGNIMDARFSRDGRALVTASADRTARVWNLAGASAGGVPYVELAGGHTGKLASAEFSPDGRRVVTAGADHDVSVWDSRTGNLLATLHWHGDAVNEVRFSPDGTRIVTASDDGSVKIGRCDECNLSAAELRQRVDAMALLTKAESARLRQDLDTRSRWSLAKMLGRASEPTAGASAAGG